MKTRRDAIQKQREITKTSTSQQKQNDRQLQLTNCTLTQASIAHYIRIKDKTFVIY